MATATVGVVPIVEVEIVTDDEPGVTVAQALADGLGAALGAPAGSTWVRLRTLPRSGYAESGGALDPAIRPCS